MKYKRLTKEQFEELHEEFINFLATQSITADEWREIKAEKPELAESQLDVFSDLVWEGALSKAEYLENISARHMYLFQLLHDKIQLIGLKIQREDIDITTTGGYDWLKNNLMDETVEFFQAKKMYSEDPLLDRFKLIEQGAVITRGELFRYFERLIA